MRPLTFASNLKLQGVIRLCALFALSLSMAVGVSSGQATTSFVAGRILVQFRSDVSDAQADRHISTAGGRTIKEIPGIRVRIVGTPQGTSEQRFVETFQSLPDVKFAELDRELPAEDVIPNDTFYSSQWHHPKIAAPTAWSTTTGSSAVIIAICDTGVDGTHPDLAPKMVLGWNTWDNNSDTSDVDGHGTAVAGTAAAASNNGLGVASVAWDCLIMPVRVSAPNGWATLSSIASGLVWAADHGARVANVSYQASDYPTVTSAGAYVQSKGGVVTVSAGNDSTFDAKPDNPYVLTVSATDSNDVLASWSTTGNPIDLSAPGVGIYTTNKGGGYGSWSGTSFSAPIVAGVAALVFSANPKLTPSEVQDALTKSADDLGAAGWDPLYGAGRVNAARAVSFALGISDTTPPTVSITSPAAGATVSGTVSIQATASDNVGVTSVTISVDGTTLCTATAAPYSCSWDSTKVSNATHSITASASDAAGNKASASSVSVTVSNTSADTTPPTVSFTSPAAGTTVSGTVSIQATASDNVAVSSVTFAVDGATVGISNISPYSVSWNTTTVANGTHTVSATAVDTSANKASATISVTVSNTVADTTPPTVSITAPGAGATVTGTISVQVSATDNVGVTSVSVAADGVTSLGTAATAPTSFSWDTTTLSNGTHTLTATASDAAGNKVSVTISVTVNNPVPDTTPPTISITAPKSGSTVGTGNVFVTVNASDNVAVVKVELYVDGALTSTSTAAPFTTKWNSTKAAAGAHTLLCKAYDAAGNVGSSASITVYK